MKQHAHRPEPPEPRLTRFGYRLAIVALVLLVFLAWSAVDQDQMTVWRIVGDVGP